MSEENAEIKARSTRTEENGGVSYTPVAGRKEGAGVYSGSSGDFSIRTFGAPGSGSHPNYLALLTGGIISQLIADAEDRLGKTRECIEWYEREEDEDLARLENLKKLQKLAEQQKQANGNQIDE
jgi:hypothetical protein